MKTSTEPYVTGQALPNDRPVTRRKFEANIIVVMVLLVLATVLYVAEIRRILTMSTEFKSQSPPPTSELVAH
ncbi:MAG: hypothetical protein H7062_01050 [Candidatus Saccharimonas sp.]|nr:hypothetical protein [Planctomycetaceae bacterium]